MRDIENATLNKMKYDNMKKQAECYAKATGQTLPDNLSYNDLETISIRCFLPQYTRGEDLSSAISHIIGGALGIIMLIVGIYYSVVTTNHTSVSAKFILSAILPPSQQCSYSH